MHDDLIDETAVTRRCNNEMNITLKRAGLILLIIAGFAGSTATLAQSRHDRSSGYFEQDGRQQRQNDRRDADRRRDDRNEYRQQQRRDDRLSPDERRTLRQQIDEAGRDIYAPRRR
ncbi:MAG TPA: hypothetical protein VN114_11765 [Oxalicibacterium sp.]|uniref:hypothetical protein n=1 Tax=Oxalicibacterium sp. TaxID=2766525 RepID=UPI002B84F943|nr:hypothetical protein [Oxalicibacterium sp.]HWU99183.1 hypothetical protein [Oxalicibacterium sp.]